MAMQGKPERNQHEVTSDGVTQPRQPSPYAKALQSTGISRQTAHRYQALASVPSWLRMIQNCGFPDGIAATTGGG
jgi:hypothetical protein